MRVNSMNIGEAIRILRTMRNISRTDMSEMIGISVSHLEKIESGARRPGIDTYWKILEVLKVDMVIRNEVETVQEQCAMEVQGILLSSTETQALFLTKLLEFMIQNMEMVT